MTFDASYYQRFYHDPKTRAVSEAEHGRQAAFIAAYLDYLVIDVSSVLDIGCGIGTLLKALGKRFPKADCRGVELSRYVCEQYGWEQGSVVDYDGDGAALVLCTDVLGYLTREDCRAAIANLAQLSHAALYMSVLTQEDLEICDTERTDMRQELRSVAWYRRELEPHFLSVGGGLFLKRPLAASVWHLERT